MQSWLSKILQHICELARNQKVLLTVKARRELAHLGFGLDEQDLCDVLMELTGKDFAERLVSTKTGEWLYVFKPTVAETTLYVKLCVRDHCVVISFHENEGDL